MVATARNVRWALWPEGLDLPKPEVDLPAEETITAVFSGPQLAYETPF